MSQKRSIRLPRVIISMAVLALFTGIFSFAVTASAAEAVTVKTVAILDRAEPYEPLLFHDGVLWTGHSRKNGLVDYAVDVFTADGAKLFASVKLKHSIGNLYALGPKQVLVVGKSYTDQWRTFYSIVTNDRGTVKAATYPFPTSIQTEEFGGDAKNMFFNEIGDRAVYRMVGRTPQKLNVTISAPGAMKLVGNSLFVLERNGFELGDENIVKIDLAKQTADRTFKDGLRQGLTNLLALSGSKQLAASEGRANQVLFIDVATNKLAGTVAIPAGFPRALAQWGHCLVVGTDSADRRVVSFFDLQTRDRTLVAEWDLSSATSELQSVRALSVDPAGRIYVRSKNPCLDCAKTANAIVVASQPSGDTLKRCTR